MQLRKRHMLVVILVMFTIMDGMYLMNALLHVTKNVNIRLRELILWTKRQELLKE